MAESLVIFLSCLFGNLYDTGKDGLFRDVGYRLRIMALYSSVRTFHCEYESVPPSSSTESQRVHREVTLIAPSYLRHRSAHASKRYKWEQDPDGQILTVIGDQQTLERPFSRTLLRSQVGPSHLIVSSLPDDFAIKYYGFWPISETLADSSASSNPTSLSNACLSPRFKLSAHAGSSGRLLLSFGNDRETFVLDPQKKFAVICREFRKDGIVRQRLSGSDFTASELGIELARDILVENFDSRGEVIHNVKIRVIKVSIADVADAPPAQGPPVPGTVELRADGTLLAETPGGDQYLTFIGDWIYLHYPSSITRSSQRDYHWSIVGATVASAVLAVFWKRLRRGR